MQLQLKAHGSLPESVRTYAEKRLSKLSRRLHEQTVVEVSFARERNPSIRDDHVAEAIVHTKGPNIVALRGRRRPARRQARATDRAPA